MFPAFHAESLEAGEHNEGRHHSGGFPDVRAGQQAGAHAIGVHGQATAGKESRYRIEGKKKYSCASFVFKYFG